VTARDATVFAADEQAEVTVDLERWIRLAGLVLDAERVPEHAELSLLFVGEETIAGLNERFLGGSGPTDVLAFPIDTDELPSGRHPDHGGRGPGSPGETGEPPPLLGDVVICPSVAARQAADAGHALDEELALLVVHGTLHLLDYDHAEPDEAADMRRREHELLARFHRLDETDPP
jgi:probable rRNA maturation factor